MSIFDIHVQFFNSFYWNRFTNLAFDIIKNIFGTLYKLQRELTVGVQKHF